MAASVLEAEQSKLEAVEARRRESEDVQRGLREVRCYITITLHCIALQCSALQCSAVHCRPPRASPAA